MPYNSELSSPVASAGSRNNVSSLTSTNVPSKRKSLTLTALTATSSPAVDVQVPTQPRGWSKQGESNSSGKTATAANTMGAFTMGNDVQPPTAPRGFLQSGGQEKSTAGRSTYNPSALRGGPVDRLNPKRNRTSQIFPATGYDSQAAVYNPSAGPTASQVTTRLRPSSQMSGRSVRRALDTFVCKLSGYSRRDFKQGDVIALPYHIPNLNPNLDAQDRRLVQTCEGPAYSKRRMMVILWIHEEDSMFCLPSYSFQGKGIQGKPEFMRNQYVSMKNVGDRAFQNQGAYEPIEVQNRKKPMDPMTAIHLTGGLKVDCSEDISMVGRLTQDSHTRLVELWSSRNRVAQTAGWKP